MNIFKKIAATLTGKEYIPRKEPVEERFQEETKRENVLAEERKKAQQERFTQKQHEKEIPIEVEDGDDIAA